MIGALFGSAFPTMVYIGHPAYKRLNARAGYIIGVSGVIALAAFFGLLAFIDNLIPIAAAAPILVFVSLSLVTDPARSVKPEHIAAVTIAIMPHIANLLITKWGSLHNALQASGVEGLPPLVDAALTSSLLQEGAHYGGHLSLAQGAITTGLIWGSLVASIIDGRFRNAGGFALAAAAMSAVGIIHAPSLQMPHLDGITVGYLISAAFLFIYPFFVKEETLEDRTLLADDPRRDIPKTRPAAAPAE